MAISHCYWHLVVKNGNFTLLLTSSGQEWHFSNEIDGKTFIFRVNLGMWLLKLIILEKQALFWEFQHPFMQLPNRLMEICSFLTKPSHVTPQINCLRKMSPVLRLSTQIYGVSKEIDGKTLIFLVNLGMWLLKSIVSEKQTLFWWLQHTFLAFLRR